MTSFEDGSKRAQELREQALVALTFIEHGQSDDAAKRVDGKQLVLGAYSREEINEGAMLALVVLLGYEAEALGVSLSERIEYVRSLVRDGFRFAPVED